MILHPSDYRIQIEKLVPAVIKMIQPHIKSNNRSFLLLKFPQSYFDRHGKFKMYQNFCRRRIAKLIYNFEMHKNIILKY